MSRAYLVKRGLFQQNTRPCMKETREITVFFVIALQTPPQSKKSPLLKNDRGDHSQPGVQGIIPWPPEAGFSWPNGKTPPGSLPEGVLVSGVT